MTYLLELSSEFQETIPSFIKESLISLNKGLQAFKNQDRTYSPKQIKEMTQARNYLAKICQLKCYGYNSGKYDLPCLLPGLLTYSDKYNVKMSVLKRGNAFLSLTMQDIVFVDACNFTSGCSLDSFTRMWGTETKKSIFPYEKFDSIESLEACKEWPPMSDFNTTLCKAKIKYSKQEINTLLDKLRLKISLHDIQLLKQLDPSGSSTTIDDLTNVEFPAKLDAYIEMWIYFHEKCSLGEMNSMMDYLCFYNSLDTISLVEAFEKYIDSFIDNFDCNPNDFITLPGLAERVMWSKFDSSKFAAYTVGKSFGHINELIRDNLMGGLSCVFARHIEVGSNADKFGLNVTTASNGDKFNRIVAMDANSKFRIY